jgi:hypothetical protein
MSDFDEAGVAAYIRDKSVLNWFCRIVQQYKVPLAKQAKLAAVLLDEAVELNKGRLTLPFLRTQKYEYFIPSYIEYDTTTIDAQMGEKIKLAAVEHQLERELANFMRGLRIIIKSGHTMDGLLNQYPQVSVRVDHGKRRAIQMARRIIDDLADKLPPVSYWHK